MTRPTADNDAPEATTHRYITCEACGKRMLIEVTTHAERHRCPVCGVTFVTCYEENQGVTVRFGDTA